MKCEHSKVFNFEGAFMGMRNPLESWAKSDSDWSSLNEFGAPVLGEKDLDLAVRLCNAGNEHRKFLRQIFVSVNITAPLYIWKEMDTYKIGTTANSTSTMHKLASTPITYDCFETDDMEEFEKLFLNNIIDNCESYRQIYLETKDKRYWKALIRLLPESWLQTRTWTANYEILRNIYHQRKNHKLTEWHTFCAWIETLPYAQELIIN